MAGRSPYQATPRTDLERFIEARDLAHRWDPSVTDTRPAAVFAEFGRFRWVLVPLAALVVAGLVWLVGVAVAVVGGAA